MPDPIRQRNSRHTSAFFLLLFCALTVLVVPSYAVPGFVDGDGEALTELSTDAGVIDLRWEDPAYGDSVPDGTEFELQQSVTQDFADPAIRHKGPESSAVLSGLPQGEHYFRVREVGSEEWSETLPVAVEYVSEGKLWSLFTTGFIVAALTIGAIIVGYVTNVKGGKGA